MAQYDLYAIVKGADDSWSESVVTPTADSVITFNASKELAVVAKTSLATVSDASETVKGIVELATSAETTSGLAIQASDTRLSDTRNIKFVTAPATAASTGTAGTVAYDTDYFYVCTATDTWKRFALSTW